MGSCVSRSPAAVPAAAVEVRQAVAVMGLDGSVAQLAAPVTAREALGDERHRASGFVCSSDELYFDAPVRALAAEEALQPGQLYFVLPLSMLHRPLSGQDMAALAVKASAALAIDVSSSKRKNGGGAAGKLRRQTTARVAPLVVVLSNSKGEQAGSEWDYQQVYGKYGTHKTVGKTRKGAAAGHRSGARHRAGVQRLSAILEASE